MNRNVRLLFTPNTYSNICRHLHRGDHAEHAGAMLCGVYQSGKRLHLMVRDFIPAIEGKDYVVTPEGHGRLQPLFIHEALSRAATEGLVYVAIHNHFSDDSVAFSEVDLRSHDEKSEAHPLEFLEYPDWLWKLMTKNIGGPNRLRLSDYQDIAAETGFEIKRMKVTLEIDPETVQRNREKLCARFQGKSDKDLAAASILFAVEKQPIGN